MREQTGHAGKRTWPWVVGALVIVAGLFLAIGGAYLAAIGGSWYFVLAGSGLTVSGVLIGKRRRSGGLLNAVVMVFTLIWAIWEVGLVFWPLVSRLAAFAVLSLLVALVHPALRPLPPRRGANRSAHVVAVLLAVGLAATAFRAFLPMPIVAASGSLPAVMAVMAVRGSDAQADWQHWGDTPAGTRFAALDHITRTNVDQLRVAWMAHTDDIPQSEGAGVEDPSTPLQIGGSVYVCTAYGKVLSLDADTGAERWRFDPKAGSPDTQRCRGLGYHDDDDAMVSPGAYPGAFPSGGPSAPAADAAVAAAASADACRKRLFLPTADGRLIALDAATGKPCDGFGSGGTVDLRVGMGEIRSGEYRQASTPLVAGDVVVIGGRIADNASTDEPPGVVRAYDVHSGELAWAWDPGNPDTTKLPPAGQTYTRGTPNVGSAMAYDAVLGLVYLPTGNGTPAFWGGERTLLDDTYSAAVVAVDVKTGRPRWHFQTTHHDLWDADLPAQPLLHDVPDGNGGTLPALAQVTTQGEIFLLDRATGRPIAPVEERPVPRGMAPDERYSPTQPFSIGMPSLGNETLVESDMWGGTPFDQLLCRISFKRMRHQGVYTPPGLDRSLQFPGSLGRMNRSGVSVDPTTNYMFVNDVRLGLANYLIPREDMAASAGGSETGSVPQAGTPFGAMRERYLSPLGIPCQRPPYGTMTAIDLAKRKIAWQVPLGAVEDTGLPGISLNYPIAVGMPTPGASLATQSGLLFFAGTGDFYLRAFDSRTGKELWKARLPVPSQSGPMTYLSPRTGKQYIVVTARGARQSPQRGDFVVAYALP